MRVEHVLLQSQEEKWYSNWDDLIRYTSAQTQTQLMVAKKKSEIWCDILYIHIRHNDNNLESIWNSDTFAWARISSSLLFFFLLFFCIYNTLLNSAHKRPTDFTVRELYWMKTRMSLYASCRPRIFSRIVTFRAWHNLCRIRLMTTIQLWPPSHRRTRKRLGHKLRIWGQTPQISLSGCVVHINHLVHISFAFQF